MNHSSVPSYIELFQSGELKKRTDILFSELGSCRLCPRNCGISRLAGETGFCRSGREAVVARYCVHRGEEPVLSGIQGIGNIFFAHCNLRCVYCQNHQISQPEVPMVSSVQAKALSDIMLDFQEQGCSLVGLVTPTHVVPQIAEALLEAIPKGFRLPLVYNTNAYDNVEILKLLEGVIDIYLPDMKYAENVNSFKYSSASDYVIHARKAVSEMFRQLGSTLHFDEKGMITRGLIIRHLVMPEDIAGTYDSMEWIAENLSRKISLSLMAQYYPAYRAEDYSEINRTISEHEYQQAMDIMNSFGLNNGWIQDLNSHRNYRPDFESGQHPFENK